MTAKRYRIPAGGFVAGLAADVACIVSDQIGVHGQRVGYMYRDDWGWNLFSGHEDQRFLDNPGNLSLLTLNEAANFDRAIVPYLDQPAGTAWVRRGDGFVRDPAGSPVDPQDGPTALDDQYPVVTGYLVIDASWAITVPSPMNRRFEQGSLVLWRPGLTARLAVWGGGGQSSTERLRRLARAVPAPAYDRVQRADGPTLRYAYRLAESAPDQRQPALYGFIVGPASHVQTAFYFDSEDELWPARTLLESVGPHHQRPS
ncbi:hypothetical protein B1R94_27575 [Mycolicibacterium litorale]|nr:hypothetical protein B1R94_27575 [Mycolicibacterium litorale]